MNFKNLIKTSIVVSVIAIFAKIVGFLREAIIASYFGATSATDAFFIAQNMPGMIFPAVCTSLSTAFVSIYVSLKVRNGEYSANKFASSSFLSSLVLAIVLSIIALIIMPQIVQLIAPGFDESTTELTIKLSRITMVSFVLIMAQYMLTALLNSNKLFYFAQISGLIYSITIIFILLILGEGQTVEMLTWTVIIALVIQVFFLYIFVKKKIKISFLSLNFDENIKKVFYLSLPILLGNSIVQINLIVDRFLASGLESGAVSALSYTNSINSIVTAIFIVSLTTVLYPSLTEAVANKNFVDFSNALIRNMNLLIILLVPISILFSYNAIEFVTLIYERGNFDSNASLLTSNALFYYALGYVFLALKEIMNRGFYALGDSKTPMYNSLVAVGMNIAASVILVKILGIGGIALGTTISGFISAVFLLVSLKRKFSFISFKPMRSVLYKVVISALITIVTLLTIFNKSFSGNLFISVALSSTLIFAVYFLSLYLLRCQEVLSLCKLVRKKVLKK